LEGGPPRFGPRFTGADLLRSLIGRSFAVDYGTVALCGARFHALRLTNVFVTPAVGATPRTQVLRPPVRNAWPLARIGFRLFRFRSPLLAESRLISFPRGTEMFHFPRLPPPRLCVHRGVTPHYRRWVAPFGNPRITGYSTPTRGFSQSFTPFFGSRCQGIHRVPLLS
jgi:hypothetical protein